MGYHADLAVLRAAGAAGRGRWPDAAAWRATSAWSGATTRCRWPSPEQALLPALRAAPEGTLLLADGFSCRIQASQLAGWPALHLAELLDPRQLG